MKQSFKKYSYLFRIVFLGLSILLLIKIVDFKLVTHYLKQVSLLIIAFVLALNLIRLWLTGLRWRLLNPDVTEQLRPWHYFRFVMIAHTFNLVMPGALGGDFVKTAFTLKAVKHNRIDNVISILVDRFIGLVSILILGTAAFIFISDIPDRSAFNIIWAILYGSFLTLIIIMLNSRIYRLLESWFSNLGKAGLWLNKVLKVWRDSLAYFSANKSKVFGALLLCLPIHTFSFISAYMLARSLSIVITFFDLTLVISMVWIITAVPITVSGAGVRELSMIYFLSIYGVDPELATALSIYIYIIALLQGLLGLMFIIDFSKVFRRGYSPDRVKKRGMESDQ